MVPAMMILINYLALCIVGWLGAKYAQALHRRALWGMLFPLYPGFILSLSRNLTEIVESCFLLAGLLFIRKGKPLVAVILLMLAILARESALIMAGAILLSVMVASRYPSEGVRARDAGQGVKWYFLILPFAGYVIWNLILFYHWQQLPLSGGTRHLGVPFSGMIHFFVSIVSQLPQARRLFSIEFVYLIYVACLAGYGLRSSFAAPFEKAGWICYTILMLLLTDIMWESDWGIFLSAAMRVLVNRSELHKNYSV